MGGATTHTELSGVAHGSYDNDIEALESVRKLIGYLPSNNRKKEATEANTDDESIRKNSNFRIFVAIYTNTRIHTYLYIQCHFECGG